MSKILKPREEKVAYFVAMQGMSPREAMLEAGYSEKTVKSNGPYLTEKKDVKNRIRELEKLKSDAYITNDLYTEMQRAPGMLRLIINTLEDLMENADKDYTKYQAATGATKIVSMLLELQSRKDPNNGNISSGKSMKDLIDGKKRN